MIMYLKYLIKYKIILMIMMIKLNKIKNYIMNNIN